jgi:cobalt-zinc-cadmium efflux system membrane fusion protein
MRAEVDAARSALVAVDARNARDQKLFNEGAVSKQDWEASVAATEEARAKLRAAEAQAAAMGSPDEAGVTIVRSAITGVVTRIPTSPGAVLDDGMEIATIADSSKTELVFDAPPASLGLIAPGDHLEARWTGGQAVDAEVIGVAPGPGGAQGIVRARTMGPAPAPGTVVSGRIVGSSGERLSVPSEAVQTIAGSASVFIADANGFRTQHVVVGRTSNGRTEIISGLEGHESIAGRGAFLLKAELGKSDAGHED